MSFLQLPVGDMYYFVHLMKINIRRSQNAFHIIVNQGTTSHNIDVCLRETDDMYFFSFLQIGIFVPLMKIDIRRSQNAFHIIVNQGTTSHNIGVCLRETKNA